MRTVGWVIGALVLVFGCATVHVVGRLSDLEVVRITDDVHMITGLGSNVGVLRTLDGALVVDTMTFQSQGRAIREKVESLAGPVQVIVNTHYHADHTHGNPAFASGLPVVSTVKTRAYLEALDAAYWDGDAAGSLPNDTFENEKTLHLGAKTVRLMHLGRGHTDGDLVALFVEDRVLHTGDLFFNGQYPNIDLEAGGSVQEWSATLDRILALESQFDHVIPGHGPVTDANGIREFRRFIVDLAASGRAAKEQGLSLSEHIASAKLDSDAGYSEISIPLVVQFDRQFVLRRAWEETHEAFERVRVE